MKFLRTYRQIKDMIIKPRLVWYFGKWTNYGNLPVWRRGNIIRLTKTYEYYKDEWNYAALVNSEWTDAGKKAHPIISRIFKPAYMLPIWLSFYFFDCDIYYKTKYDDDNYCYEYPSFLSIVFFGLCIAVTAVPPFSNKVLKDVFYITDDYWETILTLLHYDKDIVMTNNIMGHWSNGDWRFRPEFLKHEKDRELLKSHQYRIDGDQTE